MRKRIVVQAGHNAPREPGFESGTGTAGEIEFVHAVATTLITKLRQDGRFDAVYQPGDIQDGIKCDLALFLHADGSASPSASGFSFGYDSQYAVNRKLADLIALEFSRIPGHPAHHADNYTIDLRRYYGYKRVDTRGGEVLVEHGFLTNPREREWLGRHVDELAHAEYLAIVSYFNYSLPLSDRDWEPDQPAWQNLPGPRPKERWFFEALEEYVRRLEVQGVITRSV